MGRITFDDANQEKSCALALILCERVIWDEKTRMPTIINSYEGMTPSILPARAPTINVFAMLERGRADKEKFALLLYGPDGDVIGESSMWVDEWRDSGTFEFELRFPDVPLVRPGVLSLRLFSEDGRLLMTRRLTVAEPH